MDKDSVIAVNDSTPLHSGSSETCQAITIRSQKNLGSEPDLKIYSVGSWVGSRARRCEINRAHVIVINLVGQVSTPISEAHTSELQSLLRNSSAVICSKKKNQYDQQ